MTSRKDSRLPIGALVFAALAVAFMVVWSIIQWPDMTVEMVTRRAEGNHGESVVPRPVTAIALPVTLSALTILLAFAPTLDEKLMTKITGMNQPRGSASTRVLGAVLVGAGLLLSVLHVIFVGMHTGMKVPIEQLAGSAGGLVLIILGIYMPLIRPDTMHAYPKLALFQAQLGPAYRLGGYLLVLVGSMTVATAIFFPKWTILIGPLGTALVFSIIALTGLYRMNRAEDT
ncbi:MAG: hypothetical protein ACTMIV_14110 [Brevibacterium aurantiacum]